MGAQKDENGSPLRSARYEEPLTVPEESLTNYRLVPDHNADDEAALSKCDSSSLLGSLVWTDPLLRPPLTPIRPLGIRSRPANNGPTIPSFFGQYQYPQYHECNAQIPLKYPTKPPTSSSSPSAAKASPIQTPTLNHRQKFWKTRLCPYHFKKGSVCKGGDKCSYAHSFAELRPSIDLTKTKLCTDYMTHGCLRPPNECPFAHGYEDLRSNVQRMAHEDDERVGVTQQHQVLRHRKELNHKAAAFVSQQQANIMKDTVNGTKRNMHATDVASSNQVSPPADLGNYLGQLEGDKNVDLNCIQALLSSLLEYSVPSSSDEDDSATREESGLGNREESATESSEPLAEACEPPTAEAAAEDCGGAAVVSYEAIKYEECHSLPREFVMSNSTRKEEEESPCPETTIFERRLSSTSIPDGECELGR